MIASPLSSHDSSGLRVTSTCVLDCKLGASRCSNLMVKAQKRCSRSPKVEGWRSILDEARGIDTGLLRIAVCIRTTRQTTARGNARRTRTRRLTRSIYTRVGESDANSSSVNIRTVCDGIYALAFRNIHDILIRSGRC
jgi:hypothetical protein